MRPAKGVASILERARMGSLLNGVTSTGARGLLLAVLVLTPGVRGRADAQTAPGRPPNTPEAYVLLGLNKIDVSNDISLATGSIGVNQNGGQLQGNGAVVVNQQDGVIAASTVHLTKNTSTCAALFGGSGSNGSGQCSTVQPITPPQPPLVLR